MKTLLTILFTVSILISGIAQETNSLEFSVGWQNYQVRDQYSSPLRYRGSGVAGGMGFSSYSQDVLKRYNVDYFSGDLKNGQKYSAPYSVSGFQYRHPQVYHIQEQSGVNYFAGIALKMNFGFRGGKYLNSFDTSMSLSLVGAATYKENPDDRWVHEASISIPFFAWATRPRYTSPSYVKKGGTFKGLSHLFMTVPKYFGIDLQVGSTYYLDNGNAFRFEYIGQYYQITPLHPVRVLTNGFKTTALMKVN